jgi:predicted nucleic acid-binding protein
MLGHTSINTTQIYAKITDRKIGNEMNVFAGNVKKLDAKFHAATVQEVCLDDVFLTLKIKTGKASDSVWETLAEKLWCVMANDERQCFISEMERKENRPKTIRDFYLILMDYFLENLNSRSGDATVPADAETRQAVNY